MAIKFRSGVRQRHYDYLIRQGFLPSEAEQFSRTSQAGRAAPYYRRMIRSRRRLFDNSKEYEWSREQYEEYIKQMYAEKGFVKRDKLGRATIDPWQLLRYHEEVAFRRGEEFTSPWRKRMIAKREGKKDVKHTTRKSSLISWISQLDETIERTSPKKVYMLSKYREQRANLQWELDLIEEKEKQNREG